MKSETIKVAVVAASIAIAGGCTDMSAKIEEARAMAEAAMDKANDAYNLAQTANTVASEASYNAEQAESAAEAAMECCNDNAQKLDRMFKKAMMK